MIPYDMDPSLYTSEPEPAVLDDGFSPPHHGQPPAAAQTPPASAEVDFELGVQSPS
ncbi:MAG TPA: hypothetical protein VN663_15705 [Ramlibacter sp.]|nr:hypothetical protein [Ramlibacter sp.]